MKRSTPTPLLITGLGGLVVGFLIEVALVAGGSPMLVPPITLPITLVLIGAIAVGFAIPVYRAVHGDGKRRVNPFQAMRTAVLAKACSLAGAALTGAGIGVVVYMLTRPLLPPGTIIVLAASAAVGALLMLVAGLIAEKLCTLPPPEDDDAEGVPGHT